MCLLDPGGSRIAGQKPLPIGIAALSACALIVASAACGSVPRDPEHTLDKVTNEHRLRVGVVESRPWVVRTGGEPAGVEPELVRRFARSLGATVQWFWGANQPHFEALERFELDLVIADLDAKNPWAKRIGLTKPYFEEQVAVGVPPELQVAASLEGEKLAVLAGDVTVAYVRKRGAIPMPQTDISRGSGPAAAPVWRLQQIGFKVTKFHLFDRNHVMAVPPGENGWLKRLSEFLAQHKNDVVPLLEAGPPQR